MLGKKTKKEHSSFEKQIQIMNEDNSIIEYNGKVDSSNQLIDLLKNYSNPYFENKNGQRIKLDSLININIFLNNKKEIGIIKQEKYKEDYYKKYHAFYLELIECKGDTLYTKYPTDFTNVCPAPEFFFNLKNPPLFYKNFQNWQHLQLHVFFETNDPKINKIIHVFNREHFGTTLLIMKILNRRKHNYLYLDLRKMNNIIMNPSTDNIKDFIIFSLYWIEPFDNQDLKHSFRNIMKYYTYIFNEVLKLEENKFTMNNFVYLFLNMLILFEFPKNIYDKNYLFTVIFDHYLIEYNIQLETIISKLIDFKFCIVYSLNSKLSSQKLNEFLNSNNYQVYITYEDEDFLEIISSDKQNFVVSYNTTNPFNINIYNEYPIFKLYQNDLEKYFGLNYHYYYFEFLSTLNSIPSIYKKEIFDKYLNKVKEEIKFNINKYFNDKEEQNFYILRFLNIYNEKNNSNENNLEIKEINDTEYNIFHSLIKNLPLNYFNIKFFKKNILNIEPAFPLINDCLKELSYGNAFSTYQSKFYDQVDNAEKGNIFQKSIEELIKIKPEILINGNIFYINFEYLIPSYSKVDPLEEYFKSENNNINDYMNETEKKDMEKFIMKRNKKISNGKTISHIIIFQNTFNARHFDLAIINFLDENFFLILLFQITISVDDDKFFNLNCTLDKDFFYISSKFEKYLSPLKCKDIYLFYVLPNTSNNIQINYKKGLKKGLENNVFLLFFGRYISIFYKEKLGIKSINFENEKIVFNYSQNINLNDIFFNEKIKNNIEKIKKAFNMELSNIPFICEYYFFNLYGNYFIIVKNKNMLYYIINIDNQILHILYEHNNKINEIKEKLKFNKGKIAYLFQITNKNKVNKISLFSPI